MWWYTSERSPGTVIPGRVEGALLVQALQQRLAVTSAALGLLDAAHPRPDELLVTHNLSEPRLQRWFESGFNQDELLQSAKRRGWAAAEAAHMPRVFPLDRPAQTLVYMVPACGDRRQWWYLALARAERAFDEREQELAGLLLRHWRACFDHLEEPETGRIILGHDLRLIHAAPLTRMVLLDQPALLEQLLTALRTIVPERWPEENGRAHDFVVSLDDRACWVGFRRYQAWDADAARGWYIELRPLEKNELPAVGSLPDSRIARAIAFLHDEFHRVPSLNQVAQAVHVSPFHFHRLFSRHVGISPKQYLQARQMQVAKWLLRSTREPIGSIASRTGFSSHGHFTSTFHKLVGMRPSEYREKR